MNALVGRRPKQRNPLVPALRRGERAEHDKATRSGPAPSSAMAAVPVIGLSNPNPQALALSPKPPEALNPKP